MKHLVVAALLCLSASTRADDDLRRAVDKGLHRLQQGAANYVKNATCFSCHHQYHALTVLPLARQRGFTVDDKRLPEQVEFTLETFRPHEEQIRLGRSIPGGNTMAVYALLALENASHKADDVTTMLVEYLLVRQKPDGSWPALMRRPPSEGSTFTNNALVLRALKKWAKPDDRVRAALERGKMWLLKNQAEDTEDRAFLLRGLIAAEADLKKVEDVRTSLLKVQADDGSWAQLPTLTGDAYATGVVLAALRESGLPGDHPALRKGVRYLVRTQKDDGSWLVTTRSRPVQKWFDNGDPHGKSQFISMAATGWAVQALLTALPPR